MKATTILSLCLFAGVLGCDKSSGPGSSMTYPLTAGTTWSYHQKISTTFRPIQPGATYRDTVIESDEKVEITGSKLLHDSLRTTEFRATSTETMYPDISYYSVKDNAFYLTAYRSTGYTEILPKRSIRYRYHLRGQSFASLQEVFRFAERGFRENAVQSSDSIYFEPHPPKVFVFPLWIGSEWTYREYGQSFAKMAKKVLSQENVTTPGGPVPAFKIQMRYDWSGTGRWDTTMSIYDLVAQQGLMGRTILIRLTVSSENGPEPIGYLDLKKEIILTSMKIN